MKTMTPHQPIKTASHRQGSQNLKSVVLNLGFSLAEVRRMTFAPGEIGFNAEDAELAAKVATRLGWATPRSTSRFVLFVFPK